MVRFWTINAESTKQYRIKAFRVVLAKTLMNSRRALTNVGPAHLLVCLSLLAISGAVQAQPYVSTFDLNGNYLETIYAGVIPGQTGSCMEPDNEGGFWLCRTKSGHMPNAVDPDDVVLRMDIDGNVSQTLKGTTRDQGAIAQDLSGNIYVAAATEGGLLTEQIFLFNTFGVQVNVLVPTFTSDSYKSADALGNRLFFQILSPHRIVEYNSAGTELNAISIPIAVGGDLLISSTGQLYVTDKVGASQVRLRSYTPDLAFTGSTTVSTSVSSPRALVETGAGRLLVLLADGTVIVREANFGAAGTFQLEGIVEQAKEMVLLDDTLFVAHNQMVEIESVVTEIPTMGGVAQAAMVILLGLVGAWRMGAHS